MAGRSAIVVLPSLFHREHGQAGGINGALTTARGELGVRPVVSQGSSVGRPEALGVGWSVWEGLHLEPLGHPRRSTASDTEDARRSAVTP